MEERELVKVDKKHPKTVGDRYIDALSKEAEVVMQGMGLELKPEVRNALFNLGLACEKALKDKNMTWEQINKDGLPSTLLYYAQLNLNPANKELYIFPYKNGAKYVLNFEESYLGKKKKVKKFSADKLKDAIAFVVREGDLYEPEIDIVNGDSLTYKPKPFNTEKIIGAVCFLRYEDEIRNRIVEMSIEELDQVKEASKRKMEGKTSSAWLRWEAEMYKKAVLKRAVKDVEIEVPVEYQSAYMSTEQIDNLNYDLDFEEKKTVIIEEKEESAEKPKEIIEVEVDDIEVAEFE